MSNRFRTAFRELRADEAMRIDIIKDMAEKLAQVFDTVAGREGAIANTHLETAVMFAVKGVTK